MWEPILIGGAAGVATNEAQRHIDRHVHGDRDNESLLYELKAVLHELHRDIKIIADHYRAELEPPIDLTLVLHPDPARTRLRTFGRKYNMIFVPNLTSSLQISANLLGLGVLTFSANTGWTELNFPEGTELFLPSGETEQSVIFRATNIPTGSGLL